MKTASIVVARRGGGISFDSLWAIVMNEIGKISEITAADCDPTTETEDEAVFKITYSGSDVSQRLDEYLSKAFVEIKQWRE